MARSSAAGSFTFSEYPDLSGQNYLGKSDKVFFTNNRDDILEMIQASKDGMQKVGFIPAQKGTIVFDKGRRLLLTDDTQTPKVSDRRFIKTLKEWP